MTKTNESEKWTYSCNRPWIPIGLCDVKAPTHSRHSVQRWRWGCQPYAPTALNPLGIFLVLVSVRGCVDTKATVRLEGLNKLKELQWSHQVSNLWNSDLQHSASINNAISRPDKNRTEHQYFELHPTVLMLSSCRCSYEPLLISGTLHMNCSIHFSPFVESENSLLFSRQTVLRQHSDPVISIQNSQSCVFTIHFNIILWFVQLVFNFYENVIAFVVIYWAGVEPSPLLLLAFVGLLYQPWMKD
jgi:hypothetical protein